MVGWLEGICLRQSRLNTKYSNSICFEFGQDLVSVRLTQNGNRGIWMWQSGSRVRYLSMVGAGDLRKLVETGGEVMAKSELNCLKCNSPLHVHRS